MTDVSNKQIIMSIIYNHLRRIKWDFDIHRMVQLEAQAKAVRCQEGDGKTATGAVVRPTGMVVVRLGGVSILISDRLAFSWSRLDGCSQGKRRNRGGGR
jgi:hypothetical protein